MKKLLATLTLTVTIGASATANAGVYSDDLAKCLVESSTAQDKLVLVKWMFTSMALHPAVRSMATVSTQQRDKSNKAAADMFVRLLTETCKPQAQKAVQYEGGVAIQHGFNAFGQVAGRELFTNPEVAKSLSGVDKHIDANKLNSALGLK